MHLAPHSLHGIIQQLQAVFRLLGTLAALSLPNVHPALPVFMASSNNYQHSALPKVHPALYLNRFEPPPGTLDIWVFIALPLAPDRGAGRRG